MPRNVALASFFTLFCSLAAPQVPGSEEPTALQVALEHALRVGITDGLSGRGEPAQPNTGVLNWLAAPPLLSASYLQSDQSWGTDETEIAVSLPFLSLEQRRINAALLEADPALASATAGYRRWQLSGVLRDLVARYRMIELELDLARAETEALETLDSQSRLLAKAGSLTALDLWLVSQRIREARTEVADRVARRASLVQVFRQLTGLTKIPDAERDFAELPPTPSYHDHPRALLMKAFFTQQLAALKAGSTQLTPWTLGVVGREFAMRQQSERQFGIALSVPIDMSGRKPRSLHSGEMALRRQFNIQRDEWRMQLREQWSVLWAKREALRAEQKLLTKESFGTQLSLNLETLAMNREMPMENRVYRRLELLRAAARPKLVAAELAAVQSQLRQLAGLSL